jgi:hypothetical protein
LSARVDLSLDRVHADEERCGDLFVRVPLSKIVSAAAKEPPRKAAMTSGS